MPLLIIILVLLAFTGGISSQGTSRAPVSESDIIISTASGGLARSTTETNNPIVTTGVSISNTSQNNTVEVSQSTVQAKPVLDTLSPHNLTSTQAKLRGEINFVQKSYSGKLYFVYSKKQSEVQELSPGVAIISVSSSASGGIYTRTVTGLSSNTTYYYRVCFDALVTNCGDTVSFVTVENTSNSYYDLPSVSTKRSEDINGENATLKGTYRANSIETSVAFFVYGEDRDLINEIPSEHNEYNDVHEEGDDLQKVRVGVNVEGSEELTRVIDDLDTSTTYYHRFCIAYDDDDDTGIRCGSMYSFETKSKQRDFPEINFTESTTASNYAQLSARISMEDYRNGHAFVVYGTSDDRIDRVSDLSQFDRVYQANDVLQRLSIETDFDSSDTVSVTVRDLIVSTYYYRFCVQYERENDYGSDVDVLACGDVESFNIY